MRTGKERDILLSMFRLIIRMDLRSYILNHSERILSIVERRNRFLMLCSCGV